MELEHPFNMIVTGQTGCGKTQFIYRLLQHYNTFDRIILAYSMFQPLYLDFMRIHNVELHEGFPEVDTENKKTLLILDDLMMEDDKKLARYFTRMRHANMSTIFVTQNLNQSSKYNSTAKRNVQYMVMFDNPIDNYVVKGIGRQIDPDHPKFVPDALRQAASKPYGYIFIDCKANREHRVMEGIFPDEQLFIYKPT